MTPRQALAFVRKCGIALESGCGPVPSLAETIAGEPIRGSWWAHPKGDAVFICSRAIRNSKDILTCRLVDGKVTYVHRRLWPALARLSGRFKADRLAAITEIHTSAGKHRIEKVAFSKWLSADARRSGASLSLEEATTLLERTGVSTIRSSK